MESSLRSRPSVAPRKVQRTPAKLAKPGAGPTPRDRGKNRVDDKIKKRMSTRYADISSPTQLSGVPAMPSLMNIIPAGQSAGTPREGEEDVRDRTGTRDDAKVVSDDKKLLNAENFDPAACEFSSHPYVCPVLHHTIVLKLKLANSTEAELKSLQSSLRSSAQDTASELQRSVFKKYVP